MRVVAYRHHDVLHRPGTEMEYAYFPLGGVASLIATDSHGGAAEMASVGREGLVGVAGALGGGAMVGEVVQQISGESACIPVTVLQDEIAQGGALLAVIGRYTTALLSQVGQAVMCIRRHPVETRAARWLLASQDRVGSDAFLLTQDFLAIMLGVTRPQVTLAAGSLKRAGLIDYTRGRVRILDRSSLEAAACECYVIIRDEFDRLLGDTNGNPWTPVGG